MIKNQKKPLRPSSWLEYLSPFGVLSNGEFVRRLFSVVGFIFLSIFIIAWGSNVIQYLENKGQTNSITALYVLVSSYAFLLFWFLLSTLTKSYRTNGVYIPFIFALLTHVLPFFFIFKMLFSSKKRREENTERANQQAAFRKENKAQKKHGSTIDRD